MPRTRDGGITDNSHRLINITVQATPSSHISHSVETKRKHACTGNYPHTSARFCSDRDNRTLSSESFECANAFNVRLVINSMPVIECFVMAVSYIVIMACEQPGANWASTSPPVAMPLSIMPLLSQKLTDVIYISIDKKILSRRQGSICLRILHVALEKLYSIQCRR